MAKFKVTVPFVVEAEDSDEARVNVADAVEIGEQQPDVDFFLQSIVDEVEPLDDDEEEDEDTEGEDANEDIADDDTEDDSDEDLGN